MSIRYTATTPKTLLNKGTGFLTGYSHTLNPYTGCSFACSYCYVRRMPVAAFRGEQWGEWVDLKQGAAALLRKELVRAKAKGPVTIFMSSSTDPYQPIEHKARITRSLLKAMAEEPPAFLFVQTRSPLVCRDMDLLARLGSRVRVSMTIETDLEVIRKHFTPQAPPIAARLKALKQLRDAGIATQATIAPALPCSGQFAAVLRQVADRVCVDDYFMGDGSGGRRTSQLGIQRLYGAIGQEDWYSRDAYLRIMEQLKDHFDADRIYVSQPGFEP